MPREQKTEIQINPRWLTFFQLIRQAATHLDAREAERERE